MYDDVLIPTDGSPGAEIATAHAFDLARSGEALVHVLYVIDTGYSWRDLPTEHRKSFRRTAEQQGRNATVRIQEAATAAGLEVVRAVRTGNPHEQILEYVDQNDVELVVMGTHGESGVDSRVGSTTERVLALADVPVMAVRLDEAATLPEAGDAMYDHVVVPTDGSDGAALAADHALDIAEHYGADLHVLYAVDEAIYEFGDAPRSVIGLLEEGGEHEVERIAADARDRELSATTEVLRGVPEDCILEYAAGVDADLIAMGTRGRVVERDHLLGSTTARVVRRSTVPVLTVS